MTPSPPATPVSLFSRVVAALFRIRTKLLLANVFLVGVPVAGLSFARTFERELLRSEEEGLGAVAFTLAAVAAPELRGLQPSPALVRATRMAADSLRAQVRVLAPDGKLLTDSGPEAIEKITRGRALSYEPRTVVSVSIGDPPGPSNSYADRAEVKAALSGKSGRSTRVTSQLRSVRLFLAEPVRAENGEVVGVVYVSRTTYPVLVSLYRVRNGLFRVATASVVVALVVAVFLGFTISRPLAKLTRAARRIAAGERGVALKLSGRDEVADLARAFDVMARELDARHNYVSELAANVSHEFKTPISSIRGAAELLREGAADDPAARERFLGNILDDTTRLSALVTRLLELSRIEATSQRGEPLDYRALVEETVERYRNAGAPVTLHWSSKYAHLVGNPEHLGSVLTNLIDNARAFSAPEAPVTVRVRTEDGAIVTSIIDRGEGISTANMARIWSRFFTTARERGGTGLGLAIVKAIVEAHGGTVGVSSIQGEGSTFWFALERRL